MTGVPYIFKVATSLQAEFLCNEDWRDALEQGVNSVKVGPIDVKFDDSFQAVSANLPLDAVVVQLLSPYSSVAVKNGSQGIRTRRIYSA
jgi:hypothetical protein